MIKLSLLPDPRERRPAAVCRTWYLHTLTEEADRQGQEQGSPPSHTAQSSHELIKRCTRIVLTCCDDLDIQQLSEKIPAPREMKEERDVSMGLIIGSGRRHSSSHPPPRHVGQWRPHCQPTCPASADPAQSQGPSVGS